MQNLKRALSLILVIAMVASFMLSAVAAPVEQLSDLADSKYQPEVRILTALNVFEGYEDGTFKPEKEMTRAELATILARIRVGGDKAMIASYPYNTATYTDDDEAYYGWACGAIAYCTDNGMVAGYGDGTFKPGETVTIVEALKMLLGALQYDADIEGLQNVGAAWKANTLSLAREAGLLNRFYGSTERNCTRDDIALLLWNFLNANVVKGYFNNDVANVDTWLYNGGSAIEVYFNKIVVLGAIVANEKANLDVNASPAMGTAAQHFRLDAGNTELFLFDESLNNMLTAPAAEFVTIKGLSTDLADIGESVIVICENEMTKDGRLVAVADECFDSGLNTVGVKTWDATAARNLQAVAAKDVVFACDYDNVTAGVIGNTNGNFMKTVDFDGDGKIDLVLHEHWGMTMVERINKAQQVITDAWTVAAGAVVGTPVPGTVVNWHEADGFTYINDATVLAGLKLADSKDAVNFKTGLVTLENGEKYAQSDVAVVLPSNWAQYTVLVNAAEPVSAKTGYNWFLDNGGYVRAYSNLPGARASLYLLTDATSIQTSKATWDATVETYRNSSDAVVYNTGIDTGYVLTSTTTAYKWGGALAQTALGNTCWTNLVGGVVTDETVKLGGTAGYTIVELNNNTAKPWIYSTVDDFNKYGDWNVNNGGNQADTVYTTTETAYYYVVKNWNGTLSVNYYEGYKAFAAGVSEFNFDAAENVYAAVTLNTDVDGTKYFLADAVVIETYENVTTTSAPYFVYAHVSENYDSTTGLYDVLTPAGAVDVLDMQRNMVGDLGFYTYNDMTKAVSLIEEDWANYGINAGTVAIARTGAVDYYVLDDVRGTELRIVDNTPVYAVMNAGRDAAGNDKVVVKEYTEPLRMGDKIIYVTANNALKYVMIVNSTLYELAPGEAWTAYFTFVQNVIATNGSLAAPVDVRAAFEAAVDAYAAAKPSDDAPINVKYDADLYDAMLNAWDAYVAAIGVANINMADPYTADLFAYYNAITEAVATNLLTMVNENVIDYYVDGTIQNTYKALSDVEKLHLQAFEAANWEAIWTYIEVAKTVVDEANAVLAAQEMVDAAITSAETDVAQAELNAAVAAFNAALAGTGLTIKAGGALETAVSNAALPL